MEERFIQAAIALRAESYRRWRVAAESAVPGRRRQVYEALAAFECDRYDRLVRRFSQPATLELAAPPLKLPRGTCSEPVRRAKVAAEAERRTWAAILRKTPSAAPQRHLLVELLEDARRTRDLLVS